MITRPQLEQNKTSGAARNWFLWVAPFLLPGLFFQSSFFAFVSPLPFFIVTLKNKTWVSLLALISNAALVFALEKNIEVLAFPLWFWFNVGITFPLFIRRFKKVPLAFGLSFLIAIAMLASALQQMASSKGLNIPDYMRSEIILGIERMQAMPEQPIAKWVEEQGKSGLVKNLMVELPSGILIAIILCYWFNLLLAFRTLPGFLSRGFWGGYKTPQWLVWPTLGCAILYVYTEHAAYYLGLNGLKVMLLFYGFQGMSIIVAFLNRKKIYGLIRAAIYAFAILVASPFIFALGFFDLWFDFRRKFRQL